MLHYVEHTLNSPGRKALHISFLLMLLNCLISSKTKFLYHVYKSYVLSSRPELFKPFRTFRQLSLNSLKHNLSWEPRSLFRRSCNSNYSHFLKLQILFISYSSYSLVPFLRQMKPAPRIIIIFLQTNFNFIITVTCTSRSSTWSHTFRFSYEKR